MNWRIYNLILQQMQDLSINKEDSTEILLCYLYSLLNIEHSSSQTMADGVSSPNFERNVQRFKLGDSLPDYIYDIRFAAFCRSIVTYHLNNDSRTFLEYFTPRLVSQWSVLMAETQSLSVTDQLIILYITLIGTKELNKRFDSIGTDELHAIYRKYIPVLETIPNMDSDMFVRCWKAVFYTPMPKLKNTVSKKLLDAIRFYRKHKVSGHALLKNYCQYNRNRARLDEAFNPWLDFEKSVKNNSPVSGVSIAESAFNIIQNISHEKPSDVIRASIFPYPELFGRTSDIKVKPRNDNRFECSFLLQEFEKIAKFVTNILIVNPGPDFLVLWNDHSKTYSCKCTVAVPNIYFASAYRMQFPAFKFCIFSDLEQISRKFDYVAVISTLTDDKLDLSSVFSACDKKGKLIALLPQTILSDDNQINDLLNASALRIEKIISIAPNATVSSPAKKMLLFANGSTYNYNTSIPIFFTQCDAKSDNLIIEKEYISLPHEKLSQGHTLNQLRLSAEKKKKTIPSKTRNKALVYSFSDEIKLHYTIHTDKHNASVGEVYYKALTRTDKRSRSPWDSAATQKGLRSKDHQSVIPKLESTAYYEQIAPFIKADIHYYYNGELKQCSLKTIWFCCRDRLLQERMYDDQIAQTILFPSTNVALSSIYPATAHDEDYIQAMESVIPENSRSSVKYWQLLNLIFKAAVDEKYLSHNPIPVFLMSVSKRASKELTDLRNALTKKTFTDEEEARIVSFISEFTDSKFGRRKAKRYEAESIWLLGALRLFTGMSIREACALTWDDFIKIQALGTYQLLIYKFIQDDGTYTYQLDKSSSKFSFRKIPVSPILANMLNNRLSFLKTVYGYSEADIRFMPIILARENGSPAFCRYADAVKICHKIVDSAQIPTQEIILPGSEEVVVDMNKYLGDIFYTNFKYRANHTCAFLRGELAYTLGNKGPDTFSQHYCDYSNDLIQYAMTQKLRRWTWKYEQLNNADSLLSLCSCRGGKFTVSSEVDKRLYNSMEITLSAQDWISDSCIEFEITCEHGFYGTLTVFPKGDRTYE